MVLFTFTMQRHLFSWQSQQRHFPPLIWQNVVGFHLLCAMLGNEAERMLCGGWVKTLVQFLAVSGPKFMVFWDNVVDPFQFSTPLPDCLYRLLFQRYGLLKCRLVAKSLKIGLQFLSPKFLCGGGSKHFYGSLLPWFTPSPTVWQSLVEFCGLKCVCEARQWRKTHYCQRVGENSGPVISHMWTKVHLVFRQRRRPLSVFNALDQLSISCFVPKI